MAQKQSSVVQGLIHAGFENVGVVRSDSFRIYTLQSSRYDLLDQGLKHAIDIIRQSDAQEDSLPVKIIVLDKDVPVLSLTDNGYRADSLFYAGWEASKDLGVSLQTLRRMKKENSSFLKADLVVYPELKFRNYRLSVCYEWVLNLNPALEVTLWTGMKFVGQLILPLHNDYGEDYAGVRPGFLTLSQTVRLPYRSSVTAYIGSFSNFRQGIVVDADHYLPGGDIWFRGRLGYTEKGVWNHFNLRSGGKFVWTGFLQANWFWSKYRTRFSAQLERFQLGEYGITCDALVHFRHAAIGCYVRKLHEEYYMAHHGYNAGFVFQVSLPPFSGRRRKYVPRVKMGDFDIRYNGANEKNYGYGFRVRPDEGVYRDHYYSPKILQSYINH